MIIKFTQLLTKALTEKKPHYVTRIPLCLLNETEKKYVEGLNKCLQEGWMPEIETFREDYRFLPIQSEIPIDVMYENFTKMKRDEYIAEQTKEFVESNVQSGVSPYQGMAEFQQKILDKTAIANPRIIDYANLPREAYVTNVYRSKYYLPHFEEISNGLQGGDFLVIMAGTKGFKTTLLKALAHAAFMQGKENVVFCSQEQAVMSMAQQLDMHALSETHSTLRAGIDEEQMKRLKGFEKRLKNYENKFYITPQVKSVKQLHEYITALGSDVKKVFIDGLNLMQGDFSDSYNSLQKVCAELKSYAIEHNLIIIAVTQSNREGYKSGTEVGAQHIAGSFAIAMYADIMLALSTIEEINQRTKRKENHVYIRPILNRHGNLSRKIDMLVEFSNNGKKCDQVFSLLPEDYDPQQTVISYATSDKQKGNFEAVTGLKWEKVVESIGLETAEKLMAMNQENEKTELGAF